MVLYGKACHGFAEFMIGKFREVLLKRNVPSEMRTGLEMSTALAQYVNEYKMLWCGNQKIQVAIILTQNVSQSVQNPVGQFIRPCTTSKRSRKESKRNSSESRTGTGPRPREVSKPMLAKGSSNILQWKKSKCI